MIDLDKVKEKLTDKNIKNYVETYLDISSQFENFEDEWLDGKIEEKYYNQILDMHDYLAGYIANYFIQNYYIKDNKHG